MKAVSLSLSRLEADLPRRWVVGRTFGWLGRYRRHSKDYEAKPESSLAWIHITLVRLLIQRFGLLETFA